MSWRDAPLYIEAHDLAAWLVARAASWGEPAAGHLAPRIATAACDLLDSVALALTFPAARPAHLERADNAIVILRTELRLAQDLDMVTPRGLRHACDRLREIGRMVGGWQKRLASREEKIAADRRPPNSGDEPPAAGSA